MNTFKKLIAFGSFFLALFSVCIPVNAAPSVQTAAALKQSKIDYRRTSIRPKNFNPNKQAALASKDALSVEVFPEEEVSVGARSAYQMVGKFSVTNRLGDSATLDSVDLRMRFEASNVGPEDQFFVKLDSGKQTWEKSLNTGGDILFSGLKMALKDKQKQEFTVFFRPKEGGVFFGQKGKGVFYVFDVGGTATRFFRKSGRSGQRKAPVDIKVRDFARIYFDPSH